MYQGKRFSNVLGQAKLACLAQEARVYVPDHARVTASDFTAAERAVLDALLETFAPPSYDANTTSEALRTALGRLAPHRLAKIRLFMRLLDGPTLTLILIGRFAPFASLERSQRERMLRAMADSPIAAIRTGFQVFKRL